MKKYYNISTFLIFGVFSILTTFYFPYLNQEVGLSLSEVGRVVSVGALFTIIAQPILSNIFSKVKKKNKFIILYLFGVLISIVGLMFINKDLAIIYAPIYGAMLASVAGIFEIYIEELSIKSKIEFSDVRKWGSIGYACVVFLSGLILNKFGFRILHIIAIIIICTIIFIISTKFKDDIVIKEEKDHPKFINLFKNRNIVLLMIVIFLGIGSYMGLDFAYSSYLVDLVKDVEKANQIYSFSISLRVVVEFFSFLIVSKYLINANSKKCLTIALVVAAIKVLLLSTGNIALVVLGDQLHGIMYGFYLSFLFKYLREIISSELIATSFSVLSVLSNGGANLIYPSIYSYIQGGYGYFGMYIFVFISIVIATIIFTVFLPSKKKLLN